MWQGWKTIVGIIVTLGGYLSTLDMTGFSPKIVAIAKVVTAVGAALTAYGLRDAISSGVPIGGVKPPSSFPPQK